MLLRASLRARRHRDYGELSDKGGIDAAIVTEFTALMKFWLMSVLVILLAAPGCASKKAVAPKDGGSKQTTDSAKPAAAKSDAKPELIVTPESLLSGRVAVYNTAGRFVVLDFPLGRMPVVDQTLFVYRQGLKVGEVKITGPERDHNTVADLISGEARKGDEVRDR